MFCLDAHMHYVKNVFILQEGQPQATELALLCLQLQLGSHHSTVVASILCSTTIKPRKGEHFYHADNFFI